MQSNRIPQLNNILNKSFFLKHTLKADNPNAFTIGSVGFCDQDCDFLDYTYVQLNSNELTQRVNQEISIFSEGIKNSDCNKVNYMILVKVNIIIEFLNEQQL